MNIVLTGFMGTGKSEVGKRLAKALGYKFIDTDELIEKEAKLRITEIFERKGEPFFRDLETITIKRVASMDKAVIAAGGGAVLRKENMDVLEKTGVVVCLRAAPEKIIERLKGDETRPLLKVKDPLAKIKEILDSRQKYYERCSISVDTSVLSPEEIVREILENPKIKAVVSDKW